MPCKYGLLCYQKNPTHHQKYKHPTKRKQEAEKNVNKKQKLTAKDNIAKKVPSPARKEVSTTKKEPEFQTACTDNKTTQLSIPDEDDLSASPENVRESIKQKFLVDMPEDFYSFWSFCESLSSNKPEEALKDVGLLLVGPFDVLSGKLKKIKHRKLSLYLIHWRYYYDPPEFQTIIKGDNSKQYHMGYFRDDPQELPCFVACNMAAVDCTIKPLAENIFGAVNAYLEEMKEKIDPFRKMKVAKIQTSLQTWAKEKNFTLDRTTPEMKTRDRKVVTKSFHKAGIVVPWNKKTELGYRELLETDANLKKILANILDSRSEVEKNAHFGKLQPIVTGANIATDECDFGTSLELGIDLFCFGGEVFHRTALNLLQTGYSLLHRNEFIQIAEVKSQIYVKIILICNKIAV
ncbi:hypothetical protein ANN_13351 [Periplaneta americana]|uniref:PBZ-type domain-containing protein n=1 Tax=Periplaneta americana TaxID=6978 RepID=A0ABQ8TJM6_PERAM|nr:hypothetical protein ANN_13351 [Periplaneta americana]